MKGGEATAGDRPPLDATSGAARMSDMDPQRPDNHPDDPRQGADSPERVDQATPPIPVARPASRPAEPNAAPARPSAERHAPPTHPTGEPPVPVARPADEVASYAARPPVRPDRWWAPRPMSGGQALGDILLIVAVLIVPQVASALVQASIRSTPEPLSPGMVVLVNAIQWALVAGVAIYVTYRSGQPLSSIGLRRVNMVREAGTAVLAVLIIYAALITSAIAVAVLSGASTETMTGPTREITSLLGTPSIWTMIGIAATAGIFEEIVFRGFILTRLRVLAGGWPTAILIGSVLFAVPHVWQGVWAMVLVLPVSIILSVVFVWRRSLVPVIFAHFLFNFLQLLMMRALLESPQMQEMLGGGA